MATTTINGLNPLFTSEVVKLSETYSAEYTFFQSMFPKRYSNTFEVKWDELRTKPVAYKDNGYGAPPTYISSPTYGQKIVTPPLYKGAVSFNIHQAYLADITSNDMSKAAGFLADTATRLGKYRAGLYRQIERICAEMLYLGTSTYNTPEAPSNWNRDAWSLVAYNSTNNFADNTVNPLDVIANFITTLRQNATISGSNRFKMVVDDTVLAKLKSNTLSADIISKSFSNSLSRLVKPELAETGATYIGELVCGQYIVDVYAYNGYFYDSSDTSFSTIIPYAAAKKILILPQDPDFGLLFAANEYSRQIVGLTTPQEQSRIGLNVGEDYSVNILNGNDGYTYKLELVSRPLPVFYNKQHVLTATVLP